MRLALYHNLPSGGAKRAVYEWTKRLAKEHIIDVYTLSTADHDFCDIRPLVNEYKIFDYQPRGLFQRPFGRLNQLQRWRELGDITHLGRKIALQIDAGGYDLVFGHNCKFTTIPTFLQFINTPSAYYLHEPFGPKFNRQIQVRLVMYIKLEVTLKLLLTTLLASLQLMLPILLTDLLQVRTMHIQRH